MVRLLDDARKDDADAACSEADAQLGVGGRLKERERLGDGSRQMQHIVIEGGTDVEALERELASDCCMRIRDA